MSHYAVTNPATGDIVKTYPQISDADLEKVIESAEHAYRTWSRNSSIDERAALIHKVGDLHSERRDDLAAIIVREMGKPIDQALGEVDFAADIYRYYADNAHEFLKDEPIDILSEDGTAFMRTNPLGVLIGVMPWNFPYYQVARFAGPNVVIGNTIILKHASQCPESAAAIQQIFHDAGAKEGVYTNVYASSGQVATVIADPRVQGVSLTGSEAAGSAVAEVAGRNLKKVVLELGGSDPFILLSTDDLDGAVDSAYAARMDNSGQSCNAAKRFIVIDDLYEDFRDKLTTKMLGATASDPTKDGADYGPLSSLGAAEGLDEQLKRAKAQGATVTTSGTRDGAFFPTAVITDISPDADAFHEEFFGPVASIYRVSSEDEAIQVANASPFGLGSYLFTTDKEQAMRVADKIDAGMVYINVVLADSPELPFGGVKRSGIGREMGRFGAAEFVNKKLIRVT
ncbi:succinate-semialdehyde dehydrogenase/glutarate-semialdehyde dehydrogenase [Cryobacterium mesophilum]|uniref:NAD-dependent succinate-semialdehyde dehydrogenase n=1 Tax=Terrimesophilobacter mesophilus TaxID=433647 RepID=A0A4R8VBC5_9MICO|nr:NAD-dependent succinate-semialdehyde dehydrogenase [Terrimesophilobacter mesophilus]MBB5633923.1 succinate-semialdehyde dehydrogenase/glutarate-semialdehyde dehydrogenase [Terrimesophilobacter mesophilus]TFB80591.1 NAD-dependent succinate-semialdehyde dehydrogenase [Terrimesophilobacter mesophilus]